MTVIHVRLVHQTNLSLHFTDLLLNLAINLHIFPKILGTILLHNLDLPPHLLHLLLLYQILYLDQIEPNQLLNLVSNQLTLPAIITIIDITTIVTNITVTVKVRLQKGYQVLQI